MASRIRILAAFLLAAAATALAGPAPLPAPDLSTIDFRVGPDPAPVPNVIGIGPTGKIYVGGSFTTVAGQARPGVARINVDGTLDAAWNPTLPAVPAPHLAAEDASGNVALVVTWPSNGPYNESFLYVPAATMTGSIVASEPTYYFKALRFDGADLYTAIQGQEPYFTGGPAQLRRYLGGTTLDGAFAVTFDALTGPCTFVPAAAWIFDVAVQGAYIYIAWTGGALRVAKADGTYDSTWRPNNPQQPPSGPPTSAGAQAKTTCFPPTLPSASAISASPDGWIYIAGVFETIPYGGAGGPSLRRFSAADGARDASWTVPNATASGMAHDVAAGHLYIAGSFGSVAGVGRGAIAAISTAPGAAVVAAWEPEAQGVNQMVRLADRLMIGGTFTTVSGLARKYAAALPLASEPPSAPALTITPRVLDFGISKTAGPRVRTATIRNDGAGNLVIDAITPPADAPFQVAHDCSAPLAPGATCTVTVTLEMAGVPLVGASVAVSSNGGAFPQSFRVRAAFGDAFMMLGSGYFDTFTPIGTKPTRPIVVRNTSGAPLDIAGPFLVPAPGYPDRTSQFKVSDECNGTLAAGATCTFTISFEPSLAGYSHANVYVAANVSGQVGPYYGGVGVQAYGQSVYSETDYDGDGLPNNLDNDLYTKSNDIFAATPTGARMFAMQQYRDFLGREGDSGGIDFWSAQVSNGAMSRGAVIEQFFGSPEFQGKIAPVARLYFAYFLRIPDYDGLSFWIGYYRAGHSLDEISSFFAGSAEFQSIYGSLDNGAFVNLVYQNVLGRAPDAQGFAFWKNELDTGARTRGNVMLYFSESPEYRGTSDSMVYVTMMYFGMMRRAPDQQGFDFWVGYRNQGNSGQALIDQFILSPEYHNRFLP